MKQALGTAANKCQSDANGSERSMVTTPHAQGTNVPSSPDRVRVALGDALQVRLHALDQARPQLRVDAADVVEVGLGEAPHCAGRFGTVFAGPAGRRHT